MRADLKRLKRDSDTRRSSGPQPQRELFETARPLASQTSAPVATSAARISSGRLLLANAKQHKARVGLIMLVVTAIVAAAGFRLYSLWSRRDSASMPFQNMTMEKLTNTGKTVSPGREGLSMLH